MRRLLAWLNARLNLIADDPNPGYSRLDRMDNLQHVRAIWEPSCATCGLPWSQWEEVDCHGRR